MAIKKILGIHYRLHRIIDSSRVSNPVQDFGVCSLSEAAHKAGQYANATPGLYELVAYEIAETEVGAMPVEAPASPFSL